MKKGLIVFFVAVLFFPIVLQAQQSPLYTQYMLNDYVINPAVAGSKGFFPLRLNVRNQWMGFEDAPSTQSLSFHAGVGDGRVGLGALIFQDDTGPTSQLGTQISYSYHLYVPNIESNLSFGIAPMIYQYSLNANELEFHDPETIGGSYKKVLPDASIGLYLYGESYFIGASVYQLLETTFKQSVYNAYGDNSGKRHYFLTAGVTKEINYSLYIEPSIMVKTLEIGLTQVDFNIRTIFNRKFWTGLSIRTDESIVALLGMNLETFHLAYGFDYTMRSIGIHTSGSHEISVGFNFPDPRNKRHVYYWRY